MGCGAGTFQLFVEVPMLAAYDAAPHRGHLEAVLHIFAYLKTHSHLHRDGCFVSHLARLDPWGYRTDPSAYARAARETGTSN